MTNATETSNNTENKEFMILTANEVANYVTENYRTVQKILNTMATSGEITVTEKAVNNRVLKAYKITPEDVKNIKLKFSSKKHLQYKDYKPYIENLANALNKGNKGEISEKNTNDTNVKFYEVVNENSELKNEVEKLRKDIQEKINSNVRLDADLSMARTELKYITDKSKSMESAYSEKKLEVEKLQKVVKNRNIALIALGAIFLVFLTVVLTLIFLHKGVS